MNRDVILQEDTENIMDRTHEQRGSFKEQLKQKDMKNEIVFFIFFCGISHSMDYLMPKYFEYVLLIILL